VDNTYVNTSEIKKGYQEQLVYYYNNIGKISEISGATITEDLISVIEGRYLQLGGFLPIPEKIILKEKGKKWKLI